VNPRRKRKYHSSSLCKMNVQGSVAVIAATVIETVASTANSTTTTTTTAAVNAALTSSNPPWKLRSVPCPYNTTRLTQPRLSPSPLPTFTSI
jgi:hypothetical protein